MDNSTPTQLRFPAIDGFSIRADFNGGAMSSDFGALLVSNKGVIIKVSNKK